MAGMVVTGVRASGQVHGGHGVCLVRVCVRLWRAYVCLGLVGRVGVQFELSRFVARLEVVRWLPGLAEEQAAHVGEDRMQRAQEWHDGAQVLRRSRQLALEKTGSPGRRARGGRADP